MLENIGPAEAIIIIAVLVAIFGKKKTGEIARDAGEATKELKKARKEALEVFEELKKTIDETTPAEEPKTEAAPIVKEESKEESKVKGGEGSA
ncbi:hypothetical protein COV28_01455 [candidate division WWE3 bacterium CG10_big_fil_rev_8_21_14_0_10_48_23]|uniref:Sec-independent protein translocase protein TatA n=1 Tax=candidate division WWE3 bacterium CG_4_9_14_0_2_um_filter_48_10 TaxID=1975078 RepID=A0A2M8EK64_UNCKA|nr:MAG: hypothetical protein CO059_00730 [candidate division WWE3 bacterium CG_4_9_14_0_2_um_filter_48_10]PJE51962.1 MAG: hypothetical protein COV28_01455 [candidate division WWE3 bacterium CG10_big_fil_rev_8_21_14_0_10_48_23]